ncbi:isoprenoid synthase domain-containing protein [Astrocystis sublimbata]|nr:isoprenoid synthase domain-containing protein [Astrocystis sublimbata]
MSTVTVGPVLRESKSCNTRDVLFHKVKGRKIHLPNLKTIFHNWRGISADYVNPGLHALRPKVTWRLLSLGFGTGKQTRLEAADFAFFTALWWPDAYFEELEILAYLVIWLFTWDDEIDEPNGRYAEDYAGAQSYRDETLRFVGVCLGLLPEGSIQLRLNKIIQSFETIGTSLRKTYDSGQCQRFYDEIAHFMSASQAEQEYRLMGDLPTLEQYWNFRLGTSAVYIGTAIAEYSLGTHLPNTIMECLPMKAIWRQTNIIISVTNDLMSLRKEMEHGCIDSLVPLAFASADDTEAVISNSIQMLKVAKEQFEQAATMLAKEAEQEQCSAEVEKFIETQKSNCVGNLVWSLQTGRYKMRDVMNKDGSHTFIV